MPKLSVITVTWNNAENIAEQLISVVEGCQNLELEQIVVDNGSKDTTVALIKEKFPNVKLINNSQNLGFAAANNQGTAIASGDFLLFLNPDMRVQKGSLDILVDHLKKNSQIGILSCKLVDKSGKFNTEAGPRRFPTVWNQTAILLKIPHFFPSVLKKYLFADFDPGKEQEVDSVRGAFVLTRKEIIKKLGWAFDPRYFIWFEDVDLCREVWRLGFKVVYTPLTDCVDYVGQSFKKRTTFWKQKNFTKSMIIYFKKWESPWQWIFLSVLRQPVLALAWLTEKLFSRK